jgi:hypothetical protein
VGLIENLNESEPTVERPLLDQEVLFIRMGPVKSLGESIHHNDCIWAPGCLCVNKVLRFETCENLGGLYINRACIATAFFSENIVMSGENLLRKVKNKIGNIVVSL